MSLQSVIPWQVALPQGLPPLHRPGSECAKVVLPVENFAANSQHGLNCLCQPRGQPQAAFNRLKARAPKGCPYVFLTLRKDADGNPVRIKTPRTWYEDVIAESKLKDVTWHTCRHTFISRLVMAGVDLRTVMELAGHKSMAMTLRYAHLAPEHTASAIERIARVSDQLTPVLTPRKKGHSGRSGPSLTSS